VSILTRYWKIRAGSGGEHWDTWKRKEIITVGWDVGDLKEQSWDDTREKIKNQYDEKNPGGATGIIRKFSGVETDGMEEGDLAIILGGGTVLDLAEIGEFEYHPGGMPERESHAYWRHVNFHELGPKRLRDLPEKFQMYKEFSLHLPKTLSLFDVKEEVIDELVEALKEAAPVDLEEGLLSFDEDAVQQYIERNFRNLDRNLVSVEREYHTRVGDADFLATEKDGKVVVEVKVGTAQDNAVGQLLGYLNAIRKVTKGKVRGILVAEGFTERVKEAVESDDITLMTYKAKLDFSIVK
jgi:Holliday junction resolvase-like predicted endonuclease